MIDGITINSVLESTRIEDVVSKFITLRRAGSNFTGICPFHDDRNDGNFIVRPSTIPSNRHGNTWHCFVCDEGGDAVKFLMKYDGMSFPDAIRWLGKEFGVPVDDVPVNWTPPPPKPLPPPLPKRYWPLAWTKMYRDLSKDNLVNWLRSLPWDGCQRKRLNEVLGDYAIGHTAFDTDDKETKVLTHHEWVLFWQIDEQNRVHNAHLMKYKPNGKRMKKEDDPYNQTWLHARMRYTTGINYFDDSKNAFSYCLFGQHLLNRYPNATVNVVESEKTALIMATAYGNHEGDVWMACCGMQNLNRERLGALIAKGRHIVLWPDRDGIDRWKTKANEIGYDRLSINTKMVLDWWKPEDGEKADCGDVVLRILHEARQPQPVGEVLREVIANNPAMAALNDKFGLKVIKEDGTARNT